MIEINIPGFGKLLLNHVVFDYNGTLSVNGKMIAGVGERLIQLAEKVTVHVLTADTFGVAASQLTGIPCNLHILKGSNEDKQKESFVQNLGADTLAAFGNGNNDQKMLQAAQLSIAVIEGEGCASAAIQSADIVVTSILNGLDLLLNPIRCKATLRY